jgi:hypothetical protein
MASGRNVQSKVLCNSAWSVVTLFCWAHCSWTARSDVECGCTTNWDDWAVWVKQRAVGSYVWSARFECQPDHFIRPLSFVIHHQQSFDNIPRYLPTSYLIKRTECVPKKTYSEFCFKVFDISGIKYSSRRGYVKFLRRKTTVNLKMKQTGDVGVALIFIFYFMAQQPLVGQGLLIIEGLRSHSDTPHSMGLLWASDQPNAENSTWQHTTVTTDRYPCRRRDSNPQSQQASGRRPTP